MCDSGWCVSDVCCNTPCFGACQACTNLLKGKGDDGTCGNIVFGIGPNDDNCLDMCGQCENGSCEVQCNPGTERCCHDPDPPACQLNEFICNEV